MNKNKLLKDNLKTIEGPLELWQNFYHLTQIPRPSKKEEKVRNFVVDFGKKLGLETKVDEVGNVVIIKPGTEGMENRKGIIMQAHLDMVPEKNNDKVHDFEKDPITALIDDEWLHADGTTLGADNGIGVAAAMAVLESKNIRHGPICALFTTDEETGMTGAFGIKPDFVPGEILLNLDSEEEDEVFIGCAGGTNFFEKFHTYVMDLTSRTGKKAFKLSLTGLTGGHSGCDIHLERANANKLISRFLRMARELNFRLSSIDGGNLRNAIPREASAIIVIDSEKEGDLTSLVLSFENTVKSEFSKTDPNLVFKVLDYDLPEKVMPLSFQNKVINSIYVCPNGVIRMSNNMPGLVETSNNLAIVKSTGNTVEVSCMLRSSVNSSIKNLACTISSLFELGKAEEIELSGSYPGWNPNPNSEILSLVKSLYEKRFGKTPKVSAIHAGLECGLLGGIYPAWDMISFGPTICSPHSPDEKVNIPSVQKFWNLLVDVLENAPLM